MKHWTFALAVGIMLYAGSDAHAQSSLVTLAQQGIWSASSYTAPAPDSTLANPDSITSCSESTNVQQTKFVMGSTDSDHTSFTVSNSSWSIPLNTKGTVTITVNGHTRTYLATAVESFSIEAPLNQDQLILLVWDMELGSSMQVTVGSWPPLTISLDGAKTTLPAMMNCIGIDDPSSN